MKKTSLRVRDEVHMESGANRTADLDHHVVERCRLLKLPAELREHIWKVVVSKVEAVEIIPSLRLPALLHTCRQTRQEALNLWMDENRFETTIIGCDARVLVEFTKLAKDIRTQILPVHFGLAGRSSWSNLMVWCRSVFDGVTRAVAQAPQSSSRTTIVAAATGLAKEQRGGDWRVCEASLEELRKVAGLVDPRWLE